MKILYFDCSNGISSDMILKALTDLGDCSDKVAEKMSADDFSLHNEHTHVHERSYSDVKNLIENSSFPPIAKETALKIYNHIAEAEAKVHERELETVHFHEVGRDEAVKNALGIGMALEIINPDKVLVSTIYDGKGTIMCSHGEIPVPVPAVMALREKCSYKFETADVNTEMVTPSGLAAIMGMDAKQGELTGKIIKETEAKGKRDIGRGGLKAYITEISEGSQKSEQQEEPSPVRNPELKNAVEALKKDSCMENSVRLLNEVVRAKLLIPVSMDKSPIYDDKIDEVILEKDTQISFELIKSGSGALYYPVFTDGEEMKKCSVEKNQRSLIVNFDDLAAMLLQPQNVVAGFTINPMSDNLCFSTEMIAAMKRDMEGEVKK